MESCRALILDDEDDLRELIALTLEPMGVQCVPAAKLAQAKTLLEDGSRYQFCITDMRLPDGDGLELVAYIQRLHPDIPVAVITAHGNVETAVEALKLGAFDFVSKPFDIATLRHLVNQARKLAPLPDGRENTNHRSDLIGRSPAMEHVRAMIRKLARSQAPVLVSGESGTGKEVVARLIHAHGPRADRPFIPVNCGAIPAELMESEFFGHKRGAFTGANTDKQGLFQAAEGGTLFLDEVAELPPQCKSSCCVRSRSVQCARSARRTNSLSTFVSSQPVIRISCAWFTRAAFARTFTTDSTSSSCACRRCANALKILNHCAPICSGVLQVTIPVPACQHGLWTACARILSPATSVS